MESDRGGSQEKGLIVSVDDEILVEVWWLEDGGRYLEFPVAGR